MNISYEEDLSSLGKPARHEFRRGADQPAFVCVSLNARKDLRDGVPVARAMHLVGISDLKPGCPLPEGVTNEVIAEKKALIRAIEGSARFPGFSWQLIFLQPLP